MAFAQYGKQFLVSGSNSQESIFEIQFTEGPNGSGWGYRGLQGGRRFDTGLAGSFYSLWGGTGLSSDFALSFDDSDIRFKWSIGTMVLMELQHELKNGLDNGHLTSKDGKIFLYCLGIRE